MTTDRSTAQRLPQGMIGSPRLWGGVTVFARLALGIGFLSAVADRFGIWGEPGTNSVSWGGFDAYLAYVGVLAPYVSGGSVVVFGWVATVAEIVLGLALVFGLALRFSALASAATLLVFGLSMLFFVGAEAPLSASVFSAAGLALMLALAPPGTYAASVDRLAGLDPRTHHGRARPSAHNLRRYPR